MTGVPQQVDVPRTMAAPQVGEDPPSPPAESASVLFDRHRLRTARELRGLSQVELARDAGGVQAASLSQFETGHTRPSAATLRRLATVLAVPIDYLAPVRRPTLSAVPTDGFFRSLRSTSPRERAKARALVSVTHGLINQLDTLVRLPDLDLPRLDQPPSPEATREEIEEIALDVRNQWGLPPGPVANVIQTIERHGVVATRFKTEFDKIDAFSVLFADRPIMVLGADKGLRDRSRFDAAHELGHLIMHEPSQAGEKVIEQQANWFAAAFLMPANEIRPQLPSTLGWPTLLDLKTHWEVSLGALLMRAKNLDVMPERTYTQAMKTMSMRGWRKIEPGDLGAPEAPLLLTRALQLAELSSGATLQGIAADAGLPLSDVATIIGSPNSERPRVEV